MKHLRNKLFLQVFLIMALLQRGNARKCSKEGKGCGVKKVKDYIKVKLNLKTTDWSLPDPAIRDFRKRAIVPFEYHESSNRNQIPNTITEVKCSKTCRGHEMDMNAVPIQRNIYYLRKEKNFYVLETKIVTVGCTCVFPEVKEQKME
ncbi:interleukin-17A-like [Gastrophryne carolinensis]